MATVDSFSIPAAARGVVCVLAESYAEDCDSAGCIALDEMFGTDGDPTTITIVAPSTAVYLALDWIADQADAMAVDFAADIARGEHTPAEVEDCRIAASTIRIARAIIAAQDGE